MADPDFFDKIQMKAGPGQHLCIGMQRPEKVPLSNQSTVCLHEIGRNTWMSDTEAKVPTIAIVDDDPSVRITMSSLVRSLGFNAMAFSSAEEYLLSPHRYRCSCLISDVQMPGMSGFDLQSQLAAQDHRVPIIFITAFPHPNIEKRSRAARSDLRPK